MLFVIPVIIGVSSCFHFFHSRIIFMVSSFLVICFFFLFFSFPFVPHVDLNSSHRKMKITQTWKYVEKQMRFCSWVSRSAILNWAWQNSQMKRTKNEHICWRKWKNQKGTSKSCPKGIPECRKFKKWTELLRPVTGCISDFHNIDHV